MSLDELSEFGRLGWCQLARGDGPEECARGFRSIGIALGSASQIALFVAPVLVLISYVIAPVPMDLQLWPGAVAMMLIATLTAFMVANGGRSAWFVGVLVLNVYFVFATALYLLPPKLP